MYSVLVTTRIPGEGLDILEGGVKVELREGGSPITREELIEGVKDKDGLLCMLTDRVDKQVMEAAGKLRVISNYAVGFNNIDVEYATRRGIYVTNTPGVLTDATADLTWALILCITRRVIEGDRFMREGKFTGWSPMLLLGIDLKGKKLGIVGMGRIGKEVVRRACGFKVECIYYDVNRLEQGEEKDLNVEYRDLYDLFKESDIVSLHVPLTQNNFHFINKDTLELMKPTAYLINTARGELVDEASLIEFLKEGRLAGAALDVFEGEPFYNKDLLGIDNLLLVPHVGSATVETRSRMAVMAARNLLDVLEGRIPGSLVNPGVLKGECSV